MHDLFIDLETFSPVSLKKAGVYPYAESPDFEILLFGYSVDGGPVRVADLTAGEQIPGPVLSALTDPEVTKWAYHAAFERICLSCYLKKHHPLRFGAAVAGSGVSRRYLPPDSWRCHKVWAAYLGLPLSLEDAGLVLKLDRQKLSIGKELIPYFCSPCAPTLTNGGRTRNLPVHAPEKWALFKQYNKRDVETELEIHTRLRPCPVPEQVWQEYVLDQEINDRGIAVDVPLVQSAIALDTRCRKELTAELKQLTGLENPNSTVQMKRWLEQQGVLTDSLDKKAVATLLPVVSEKTARVLRLRSRLNRSSIKKYQAMMDCLCPDGRVRGCFQFYGANRSGRWAGRHIQLQNLPQNHLPDLERARILVRIGDCSAVFNACTDLPDTLCQLIRTAFVPAPGKKFVVSDYSAIEARVLAWLAGEKWRLEVFQNNGDIYSASAAEMFGVPVEKHGRNSALRQKGKIAELALGYGGSVGALKAMGALELGMKEEELQALVDSWRSANPSIVQFWWDVDEAVKQAALDCIPCALGCLRFIYRKGVLFIRLPSGRCLSYVQPKPGISKFGTDAVTYMGTGPTKKWERIESYGPKFTENIVQAISRDLLAFAMKNLNQKAYPVVAHVHDEVIVECPPEVTVEEVCEIMSRTPDWLPGLPLHAEGFESEFYRKE